MTESHCDKCEITEFCSEIDQELTCEQVKEKYESIFLSGIFKGNSNNPQNV